MLNRDKVNRLIDWQQRKKSIKKLQLENDHLAQLEDCTWNKGITKPFVVKKQTIDSKVA